MPNSVYTDSSLCLAVDFNNRRKDFVDYDFEDAVSYLFNSIFCYISNHFERTRKTKATNYINHNRAMLCNIKFMYLFVCSFWSFTLS